jgi:hypothetical protein
MVEGPTTPMMVPSAEQATATRLVEEVSLAFQVDPESVEVQIPPFPTATAREPSAESATPDQPVLGALLRVQVVPDSGDVQMPWALVAARMLDPFEEQATADHAS